MIKCIVCNQKVNNGVWIKQFNGVLDELVKVHHNCVLKLSYKLATAADQKG